MSAEVMEVRAVKYRFTVDIEAPKEQVWSSLVDETDAWWLADFRCAPGSVVHFDSRAGGQFVEAKPDGDSMLWYTVHMCTPGESIRLVGHIGPDWSGPCTTMLHLSLAESADGKGTVLSVEDALYGHVPDSMVNSLDSGWQKLFGEGLKPHAEGKK